MNLCHLFVCAGEMWRYALVFVWAIFCPKAVLAARVLAMESQLAVCKHRIEQKKDPHPRFTAGFRLLWIVLSKILDKWEDYTHLMKPGLFSTVRRHHPQIHDQIQETTEEINHLAALSQESSGCVMGHGFLHRSNR